MNPNDDDDENSGDFDYFGESDADAGSSPDSDFSEIDRPEEIHESSTEESPILEPIARSYSGPSSASSIEKPMERKMRSPRSKRPIIAAIAGISLAGLAFAGWHFWPTTPDRGNGTVTPGTVTPGTVTPGTVTPGTVTPGTVTPGTVTPGNGIVQQPTTTDSENIFVTAESVSVPEFIERVKGLDGKENVSADDLKLLQDFQKELESFGSADDATPKSESPESLNDEVAPNALIRSIQFGQFASFVPVTISSDEASQPKQELNPEVALRKKWMLLVVEGGKTFRDGNYVKALNVYRQAEFFLLKAILGSQPDNGSVAQFTLDGVWTRQFQCQQSIDNAMNALTEQAKRAATEAISSAASAATSETDAETASEAAKLSAENSETSSANARKHEDNAKESAVSADDATGAAQIASNAAEAAATNALLRQSVRSALALDGGAASLQKRLLVFNPANVARAANENDGNQLQGPTQEEFDRHRTLIESLTPTAPDTLDTVLEKMPAEQLGESAQKLDLLQRQVSLWEQSRSEARVQDLIANAIGKTPVPGTPVPGAPGVNMNDLVAKAESAGKKAANDALESLKIDEKISSRVTEVVDPQITTVSNNLTNAKNALQTEIANLASQGISPEKQTSIESNVVTAVLKRMYGDDGIPLPLDDGTVPAGAARDYFGRGIIASFSSNCPDYFAAKKYFGLAARIKPNDPVYRYFLAATLRNLGEDDEAVLQARAGALLEKKLTSSGKSEIAQRLESLQGGLRQWIENMRLTAAVRI